MKKRFLLGAAALLFVGSGCTIFSNQPTFVPSEEIELQQNNTETPVELLTTDKSKPTYISMKEDIDLYVRQGMMNKVYGYDVESASWVSVTDGTEFYELLENLGDTWLAKRVLRGADGRAKSDGALVFGEFNDEGVFEEKREIVNFPKEIIDYTFLPEAGQLYVMTGHLDTFNSATNVDMYMVDSVTGRTDFLTNDLEEGIWTGYRFELAFNNTLYFQKVGGEGGCWWGELYAMDLATKEVQTLEDLGGCVSVGDETYEESTKYFGMQVEDGQPTYYFSRIEFEGDKQYRYIYRKPVGSEGVVIRTDEFPAAQNSETNIFLHATGNILQQIIELGDTDVVSETIDLLGKNGNTGIYTCRDYCSYSDIMDFGSRNMFVAVGDNGKEGATLISLDNIEKQADILWPAGKGYPTPIPMN